MANSKATPQVTLADLYPKLDDRERAETEENLDRYLELALRIYERLKGDEEEARRQL